MRLLICVLCHNRKEITRIALESMMASASPRDEVRAYNDGSTEYDGDWLAHQCDHVVNSPNLGTEIQRVEQLTEFRDRKEFDLLYFSDNDAIMDPTWRENALRIQAQYGCAPLCLYNTDAHVRLTGNTIEDDPAKEVIMRRYAPGISYLLTREHVARLNLAAIRNFDWHIPDQLGNRFAVTRTSYVDHIGYGGLRHPPAEGYNGGDRALNPTPTLIIKRAAVVAELCRIDPTPLDIR